MKKIILFSIMIAMFGSSCKKDHKNAAVPDKKTYKVNFNVTGFTQQILGSTSKQQVNSLQTFSNPLDSAISVLYYVVYDQNNAVVSQKSQTAKESNFGNIYDELPAGTYKVVFGGGGSKLLAYSYPGGGTGHPFFYYAPYEWQDDFFFKQITLTVSSGEVSQNVSLDRVVGKLTVNIEDALLSNASSISVTVDKDYEVFPDATSNLVKYGVAYSYTRNFAIPQSALGTTNYKVSMLMINTVTPFNVTINCYDSANKIIGQATVPNISLQPNTQTILSGELFGSNNGVTVGVTNFIWDPTPITISF